MDKTLYINNGLLFWIIQAIPDSQSADAVTIEIRRLEDNFTWNFSTLAFTTGSNVGSMTFINGIVWKQSFTPLAIGTYVITITHVSFDVKFSQTLIVINQATAIPSLAPGTIHWIVQAIPESLTGNNVTVEIRRLSDGYTWNFTTLIFESATNSGVMAFINGISWKTSFTPPTQDTYIVTVTHVSFNVKYVQVLMAKTAIQATTPVTPVTTVTAATLLAAVEIAIQARLIGGAVQSYSIGGRNLQYMTLTDLMKLRDQFKNEIATASGGARNYVTFTDPD